MNKLYNDVGKVLKGHVSWNWLRLFDEICFIHRFCIAGVKSFLPLPLPQWGFFLTFVLPHSISTCWFGFLCAKKNHFVGKKISKIMLSDVDKIFNKIESYCPLCLLSLSFPILLSLTKCSPFSLSLKEWRWFILWLSVGCEDQRLKANITSSPTVII